MTDSNRTALIGAGIVAMCAIGAVVWFAASIRGLQSGLDASSKASESQMTTISSNINLIYGELVTIRSNALAATPKIETDDDIPPVVFKTDADAVAAIATLRKSPTAATWARAIAEIDGLVVTPKDQAAVQNRLSILIPRPRRLVRDEVTALQKTALKITPSAEGTKKLDEADNTRAVSDVRRSGSNQGSCAPSGQPNGRGYKTGCATKTTIQPMGDRTNRRVH